MVSLIKSGVRDCINIKSGLVNGTKAGNRRMLFMPHSPGVYVALVLRDAAYIEQELDNEQETMSNISAIMLNKESAYKDDDSQVSQSPPVQRLYTENCLFLDLTSLSKSFQTILTQFTMLVVARVRAVNKCIASNDVNPYMMNVGSVYFQCQIQNVENIVGFEGDQYGFTNYQCQTKC